MSKQGDEFEFRDAMWVGRKLKLDKNTVYKFLQEGTIPAVQLGRKWFVSERQLLTWMTEESMRQAAARRKSVQTVDRALRKMVYLSRASRIVVRNAFAEARRLLQRHLGTEHLLVALSESTSTKASKVLADSGVSAAALRRKLESSEAAGATQGTFRPRRRLHARQAMRIAQQIAADSDCQRVEPEHLLAGILQVPNSIGIQMLASLGCDVKEISRLIEHKTTPKGKP